MSLQSAPLPMMRISCLLLIISLLGCGGARLSPVEGTVTLDGKPLANASIQFVPQGAGKDATGGTDKSGHFVMSTLTPKDGVAPGSYKVVIAPPRGEVDTTRYGNSADAMDAASKAPPKKSTGPTLPEKYSRPDQTPLTQEVPAKGSLKFDLKSSG